MVIQGQDATLGEQGMPLARVGDVDLYHERAGSGRRLLYISGTGGDLRLKPGVFDGPLPSSFQVLAFDQRGMGRSSKPDEPYSMAGYADDAAGLMDAVGWDEALVMGVSSQPTASISPAASSA